MKLVRALISGYERSYRPKVIASRTFWQQQSNVPVYIRGKGDSLIIGLSCGLLATGLGMSGYGIYNMIKPQG